MNITNSKFTVLGISSTLRSARRNSGLETLPKELSLIESEDDLNIYLSSQVRIHLSNFISAGRAEGKPFDQIYRSLRSLDGKKGLSNSEAALCAALWSAQRLGATISIASLAELFGKRHSDLASFRSQLMSVDAIILASPVYFGDRGSLSQLLFDFIRSDSELLSKCKGKIYGGIAVGAKRNGGQETTLIYQLYDMINLGFLGVGNDSETTSQYGGTGVAGDVGTMASDSYGLQTICGLGRRVARVTNMLKYSCGFRLKRKPQVLFLKFNNPCKFIDDSLKNIAKLHDHLLDFVSLDVHELPINSCLACDICPTHVDKDSVYRCIIKSDTDSMSTLHNYLLQADVIIPVLHEPVDSSDNQFYQEFIERTRYLRRGDYVLGDTLTFPLVYEELGSQGILGLRAVTSMLRHHTVVSRPIKVCYQDQNILNLSSVLDNFSSIVDHATDLTKSRILALASSSDNLKYNPVGYVLSSEKDYEDQLLNVRRTTLYHRQVDSREQRDQYIEPL